MANNIDKLRDLILSPYQNVSLIRFVAKTLCEEELKSIVNMVKSLGDKYEMVLYILLEELDLTSRLQSFKDEQNSKIYKKNESVSLLLQWFTDRKSRKVIYARKELQTRFLYLTYNEQVLAMKAMLHGGKKDREWCYKTLRKWWSDELISDIDELWNKYQEERCGWLFPRYMPMELIRQNINNLCYDSNYYQICKRLAGESWFVIDKIRLRSVSATIQFMWVMSQTPTGLTSTEALQIVFGWIAYIVHSLDCDISSDSHSFTIGRKSQFCVGAAITNTYGNLYIQKLYGVDKILASMCKMGLYAEVERLLAIDYELHCEFLNLYADEEEWENYFYDDTELFANVMASNYAHYFASVVVTKFQDECFEWEQSSYIKDLYGQKFTYRHPIDDGMGNGDYPHGISNPAAKIVSTQAMNEKEFDAFRKNNPAIDELVNTLQLTPKWEDEPPF